MLKKLFSTLETFIKFLLTAVSFILLVPTLGYIVYYLFVCYNVSRVIAGVVVIYILLHLNKSL